MTSIRVVKSQKLLKRRILIVDDHPLVLAGIRDALAARSVEVHSARNMQSARRLLGGSETFDLVLLDIHLEDGLAFELAADLRKWSRDTFFAFLTSSRDWNHLTKARQLGARGFLLKDAELDALADSIDRILAGETVFPGIESPHSVPAETAAAVHSLTDKEREVMRYTSQGLLNREIAERMNVALRTVESHRAKAAEKLGAKGTIQLASILATIKHLL